LTREKKVHLPKFKILTIARKGERESIWKILQFSSLTSSRIWLIPLVDDHQCGYARNCKKKKKEKTLMREK
jgi:hypothetical protein